MKLGLGLSLTKSNVVQGFPNAFSVDFDGTNDYVVADMPSAFSGITLNNFNCTMSAWAKFDTIGAFEAILCMGTFNLEIAPLATAEVGIWINNAPYSGATYAPTMGEWNHYAMTKSGNNYSLYIDGSLYGTGTDSDNATVGDEFFIGRNGHTHYLDGNIDEAAVWDVALDADAIAAIYNSGTPTDLTIDSGNYDNSSDLQGYWRMGDGTLDEYPLIADQTNATLGSNLQDTTFNEGDLLGFTGATATGFTAVNADSGVGANDNAYGKALSLTAGDIYKLSWTTTINSYDLAQQVDVAVATVQGGGSGDTATAGTHTAAGDYVNYFEVASTNTYYIVFRLGGNREYDFTISNVSLQKVNGNAGLMNNMASEDIEEDTP